MKHQTKALILLSIPFILKGASWASTNHKDTDTDLLTGIHLVRSQDKILWEVWADQGRRYSKKNEFHLDTVKGVFTINQKETLEVTGQKSFINWETKDLSLKGHVVAQTPHGNTLKTDQLFYSSLHHTLESPTPIEATLTQGTQTVHTIKSSRMSIDLKSSLAKLQGNVSVQGFINGNKPFFIQSSRAIWRGSSHSCEFFEKVLMRTHQITISGLQLQLNYHKKTSTIVQLIVTGNVKAYHEDKIVTSRKMEADLKKKQLVFTGQPKVVQGHHELKGNKIVFHLKKPSIQVYKAQVKIKDEKFH